MSNYGGLLWSRPGDSPDRTPQLDRENLVGSIQGALGTYGRNLSPKGTKKKFGLESAVVVRTSLPLTLSPRMDERGAQNRRKGSSSQIWKDFCCGVGSGTVCALVCSPLDVAKIRLQVQGNIGVKKYNGLLSTILKTWREENIRGLYRGFQPSVLAISMSWAIYFPLYNSLKLKMKDSAVAREEVWHVSIAAVAAGAVQNTVTNPLWVVRTRMMTAVYHGDNMAAMSTAAVLRHIFVHEGFAGLYKGLKASFFGLSHVAIQFPLYEELKRQFQQHEDGSVSPTQVALCSGISKAVASSATYPHEVIRSTLHDWRGVGDYGAMNACRHVWYREGISGFYRGFFVNLTRVIPASITTFVAYETLKSVLEQW